MSFTVRRHPLSWYLDRLERGEPTVSLIYGDGEFLSAARLRTFQTMQAGEQVTRQLEDELRDSLTADGPDLVRGTDEIMLDWPNYKGGDFESVKAIGLAVEALLADVAPGKDFGWVDGTIWEESVQRGELAPLIRWLRQCPDLCVVGCSALLNFKGWPACTWVTVPPKNAAADLDRTTHSVLSHGRKSVYVLCCGLSAIPLALRIRSAFPGVTILDLGSTFDVFVSLGRERGWRDRLYNDPPAWKALCRQNLEGVV